MYSADMASADRPLLAAVNYVSRSKSKSPLVPVELWFALATLAACLIQTARAVQFLFAPLCCLIGCYLANRSPARYVRFVLLLWFFTPFVRRLADYHAGYVEPSLILLGPILASGVAAFWVLRQLADLFSRSMLPVTLTLLGLAYGLIVGLLQCPLQAVLTDCLKWSVPVIFAAYCFTLRQREDWQSIWKVIQRTFTGSLILMTLYGIWQSVASPPWDVYWLLHTDATSFGAADKNALRVFSTMNSPGPFACITVAAILLLTSAKSKMARFAQLLGFTLVILSEVRSAWIGLAVAAIYLFLRSSTRDRFKMIGLALLGLFLLAFSAGLLDPSQDLTKRFTSLTNLATDESTQERLAGSQRAFTGVLERPLGSGMGYLDSGFYTNRDGGGTDLGNHDNGLFEFLATLGVPGTLFYGGGLLLFLFRSIFAPYTGPASDRLACTAVCVSILVQLPTGNSLLGVDGFVFWLVGTVILAPAFPPHSQERSDRDEEKTIGKPGLRASVTCRVVGEPRSL